MGDLKRVHAGFSTEVGLFEARTEVRDGEMSMEIETPVGTKGEVTVPLLGCKGRVVMKEMDGRCKDVVVVVENAELQSVSVGDVEGGKWKVSFACEA